MSAKVSPTERTDIDNNALDVNGLSNTFITNERGQKLHCWTWNPVKSVPIRALVYLCHGFGEHLQWYDDLAVKFSSIGVLAFGHDHVGHGKSDGTRAYVESVDEYTDDVTLHCEQMIKKHNGLRCFIVGHSMGGMIAILTAMKNPNLLAGAVLMGPLIKPNPQEATTFKVYAARAIAMLFPYFPVAFLDVRTVTRDNEMLHKFEHDPIRYSGGIRAQWSVACINSLATLNQGIERVQWPFLILHGEKDKLCDPEAAVAFYRNAGSKDKDMKIFPDAFHHLYLEIPEVRREAMEDTVNWVKDRL